MEFENLKGVLGDAYHEGITADEVNKFFAGKNFADLSTGHYVDKNKYDRDIQELNNTISSQKAAIDSKLTDDEKKQADFTAKDNRIKELEKLLKENSITSNRDLASGNVSSVRSLLDIKDDDTDFVSFLDNIVSEDRARTASTSSYFAKVVKDAYEKGQKDATKDSMGQFGKGMSNGNSDKKSDKTDSIGALLGKQVATQNKKQTVDYFKR